MTPTEVQQRDRNLGGARPFEPYHRWDHNFFLGYVGLVWFVILMGFVPEVIEHIQARKPPFPLVVHVHAVVFVGWLLLLTIQVLLVRVRRTDLHRKLGMAGAVLSVAVVALGLTTSVIVDRHNLGTPQADPAFFSVQLLDMVAFAGAIAAAIALRSDAAVHKRLVLLAVLSIVDAGYVRWLGDPMTKLLGDGFWPFMAETYLANGLLILGIGAYDLVTRGRLLPAYVAGAAWVGGWLLLAGWLYVDSGMEADCAVSDRRLIAQQTLALPPKRSFCRQRL